MDINFHTEKLAKTFNSEQALRKKYGPINGRTIMLRMELLKASPTLNDVPYRKPDKRHELKGKRKGTFAVSLKHPFRLVFAPNHEPVPKRDDGGIDLNLVTSITILSVEDYH